MNAAALREYLARLDAALAEPARLCVFGSAALMLMGQEDRFSVAVDVAGPYSTANERALAAAAEQVGLPVNPADDPTDQADIQFLIVHQRLHFEELERAVDRLPDPFRHDALVRENLENLRRDLPRWTP